LTQDKEPREYNQRFSARDYPPSARGCGTFKGSPDADSHVVLQKSGDNEADIEDSSEEGEEEHTERGTNQMEGK